MISFNLHYNGSYHTDHKLITTLVILNGYDSRDVMSRLDQQIQAAGCIYK